MSEDSAREYLRQLGVSDSVVEGGLEGLVENWERVVLEVANEYQLDLDSYLNDMDLRQLIEDVLALEEVDQPAQLIERIAQADRQLKTLVEPAGRCLWSEQVAVEAGWNPEQNWWYYSRPIKAGPELIEELNSLRLRD
jgi:hypothetical protein